MVLDGCSMAACELGAALWPDRTGRRWVSSSGGGDYAAQMLLGRMRKIGLVRTTSDPGSSRWELTARGREVVRVMRRITDLGEYAGKLGIRGLVAEIEAENELAALLRHHKRSKP